MLVLYVNHGFFYEVKNWSSFTERSKVTLNDTLHLTDIALILVNVILVT